MCMHVLCWCWCWCWYIPLPNPPHGRRFVVVPSSMGRKTGGGGTKRHRWGGGSAGAVNVGRACDGDRGRPIAHPTLATLTRSPRLILTRTWANHAAVGGALGLIAYPSRSMGGAHRGDRPPPFGGVPTLPCTPEKKFKKIEKAKKRRKLVKGPNSARFGVGGL